MPENGRLTPAELSPIPGGELANDAAHAWNAPGGPADRGLRPAGPISSYRTLAEQWGTWNTYLAGGPLAAYPGTSNHGNGTAVDLKEWWMRVKLLVFGGKYGWRKTEAFSEWWHFNWVGGGHVVLKRGHKGRWVRRYRARLRYLRPRSMKRGNRFDADMERVVRSFQKAHGLKADGVIGGQTAYRINLALQRRKEQR
jgi:hypothetical protein